jgi:hypothetical protein
MRANEANTTAKANPGSIASKILDARKIIFASCFSWPAFERAYRR